MTTSTTVIAPACRPRNKNGVGERASWFGMRCSFFGAKCTRAKLVTLLRRQSKLRQRRLFCTGIATAHTNPPPTPRSPRTVSGDDDHVDDDKARTRQM